jgi:N-acetylmuramoyl-L-alanine amidase
MPAALFEVSYVSNAVEERRLASEDYKGRLADAIANAIMAYREGR